MSGLTMETHGYLDALEAVAKLATQGPWIYSYPNQCCPGVCIEPVLHNVARLAHANAKHIATFDPPTCLALVQELATRRLAAENDARTLMELRAEIQRLREARA